MRFNLKFWVLATACLVYLVIILGAYTRLKDAGLGCPDWPGCYGSIIAPTTNVAGIEVEKAWIEMIHRYVAGTLGLLILGITVKLFTLRKHELIAWRWSCLALGLVVFQALLGMWTVTLRLYPIVVMGHLLGGFAIFAVTWLIFLSLQKPKPNIKISKFWRYYAMFALAILILQIALGGWTSANYAALVCKDFPQCQGNYWPTMDWQGAFNFRAVGIFDSPGIPLENAARVTIQMAHRLGALVTTILLSILCFRLIRIRASITKILAMILLCALALQIILGISNVLAGLPLVVSLLHNAMAAFLLILLVTINYLFYNSAYHAKTHTD
jgi:cytochrome c oxidase assembly protein subunit 15